jgi:PAS domain S-box-containing protein
LKPWRIALAYVAFSLLALALLAVPLWHSWRVNVGTLRVFVPPDMQALTDLFHREGPAAVAAAVRARSDPTGAEVVVFAGPGKQVLAGTMRRWPTEIPDAPGTYGHVIDLGAGAPVRIVVSHVILPDGYQLLIGRQSVGMMSLQGYFWYGMAAALAIVLALGGALAWYLARRAQALRESEERYELAMAASESAYWDWHIPTNRYVTSPRANEMVGFDADNTFLDRDDFRARVPMHPEDSAKWEAAKEELFAGSGERIAMECRYIVRGETRWHSLQGICRRDETGKVVRWTGSATDVTERKHAEEALRRSEQGYILAMEAAQDAHWDWDMVTGEYYLSPRNHEIYGFPPGTKFSNREEFLASPYMPEGGDDWVRATAELFAGTGDRLSMEMRAVVRGETRWFHRTGICVRDASGKPIRWTGSVRDVTKGKRAEEALRLSEERYALAMRASGEGHWDWKLDTDEFYASPRYLELGGFPPDMRYSRRQDVVPLIPFHPDDRAGYEAAVEAHFAGETPRVDMDIRLLIGGDIRWLHVIGTCARDAHGKPVRWGGSVSDITDRKMAVDKLRASEERYALAVAGSDQGIFDVDFNTGRVFFSARARELTGLPPGAETTTLEEYVNGLPLHPDDIPRRSAALRAHLDGKAAAYEGEFRLRQRDGVYRWRRIHGVCVRDADGKPYRMAGSISDVDARHRAEDELRESEARFRALTELSSDWYWRQDEDMRFSHLSSRGLDATGLPSATVIGKTRWDFDHVKPLSCSWAEHRAVLDARQPFRDFEMMSTLPDGTVNYLSVSGAPIFDEQGNFKGYQGIARDISERKRGVETLRESEARFRRMTELSADTYWEQDENLRYTRTGLDTDIAGYATDLNQGKTRREMCGVTAALASSWQEHEAALLARQPFRDFEYSRMRPDGSVGYYSASGAPMFDGEGRFKGYQGVARDITALKRHQEDLRSRQEMLDLAQKSARVTAFEWKVGAGRNRWSPDLEAMYGLAPGAFAGSFAAWKKLLHPRDWRTVVKAIRHARRSGEIEAEYRVVHPDGSVHWLQSKGRMFLDVNGEPVRLVGFMQDISQRKLADEELRKMEQELRRAQRLEAIGTLAGGIAHDFNNILGAIIGNGEMALRDAPKGSRLARDLDTIMIAGERGRALVDRVLAFSRSAVGERVPVHVERVVQEALNLVSAKLPPRVSVRAGLDAGGAAVLGDATQVHQVVVNLATNAIQAMPAGGTLRVGLAVSRVKAPRPVTIGVLAAGDYVVLTVADTGAGIAPEIVDRIFDPFFTTKEVGTGTGLGLSLVHGIVTELGGAIELASLPGSGCTFTVYLPRSGDAAEPRDEEESALPRGDGQRVLIVDDEEPLVQHATRALAELGYAPIGFTSSIAALEAFRAEPQRFDALVTDERMPGMSGSALIRAIRDIRGSIPVVLMSGYVGAVAGKADEVLQKPLRARDLAASLARVLSL